jgi:hypothetical protein
VNATDALLTAKHFAQLGLLNGVWLAAADVNDNGGVNTTDAQLIAQRFAGKIGSFASGDWYFEQPLVAAGGDDPYAQWVELLSLNFGDVNGSNIPTAKATPKVLMQEEGMLRIEDEGEDEVVLPVRVTNDLEIGSVSLVIYTHQASMVREIRVPEGMNGVLSWSVEGDELRIGWYSLEAVDMRAGSDLFYLLFARESAGELAGLRLEVRDNSELSNAAGEVYAYQKLSYPELLIPADANGNSLSLWPNPATAIVNLQLSTGQSAQARIELLDAVGRSVKLIHSGALENGQHNWTLDVSGLPAGTYMLHTTGVSGVSTHKLIVVR